MPGAATPDQAPARRLAYEDWATFEALLDLITAATIEYLSAQIDAGAEVVKLFDSWAGALPGAMFERCSIAPAKTIITELRKRHGEVPIIGFPRGAGLGYRDYAAATGVEGLAIDTSVRAEVAAAELQPIACVQGNLDPLLMVTGGEAMVREAKRLCVALGNGPHIFNLGHGITPDADPDNVSRLLEAIRGA